MIVSFFKGHLRKVTHSMDEQESWSDSCMCRTWVTSSFASARKQACCNVCFFCNNSDRRSCVFLICEKTDWSFFCSFELWCLFLTCFFFLKGCFPALTVYVSVTHSTLMETDDISCSLTSFTMKPDNCQTRSLALSWNHIRLAYISMCSHHIQHD